MLVDLSMPVNEDTVVFPGDAKPVFEPVGSLAETNFVDHIVHINNHLGTHMDAPAHMLEGRMLSDYGIDRFVRDAVCVDARGYERLTAEILSGAEISPGMAVLLYTGLGDRYTLPEYATDYPAIDKALAHSLIEKGVSMGGVDMISFDHDVPFPIHNALLEKDVLLIENLINLDKIAGKRFKLFALPVNFQLEAAPARVIAEIGE